MKNKHTTIGKYILTKDGKVRKCNDLWKWSDWFETSGKQRILEQTTTHGVRVSTVFLAMDYSFNWGGGQPKPILWETMIFGSDLKVFTEWQVRYATKEEALAGHKHAVEFVNRYFTKKMLKKL